MINTIEEDYVGLAHAKGLRDRRVMTQYAGRNAVLAPLTGFAALFGSAVGGLIFIEFVFSYPGAGLTLQQAALGSDYPLAQALLLFFAVCVLVANLDHGHPLRHPRSPRAAQHERHRADRAARPLLLRRAGRAARTPVVAAPPALRPSRLGAPAAGKPEVVRRHRRLHRHRRSGARGAAARAALADRPRRPSGPAAQPGLLVRHHRPGLRRLLAGRLGRADVAHRRRRRGDRVHRDRNRARPARRLQRRLGRRHDQPGHQHLPRHPDAAAADRDLGLRARPAAR